MCFSSHSFYFQSAGVRTLLVSLHPSAPALRRWREDNEKGLAFDAVREPGLDLYRAMGLGKSLQKVDSTRFAHFFTFFTRTTFKRYSPTAA